MTHILEKITHKFSVQRTKPNRATRGVKGEIPVVDENDPRLSYRISKRAKRISMRMNNSERHIIVTLPNERSFSKAQSFVRQNAQWIDVQFESLPPPQPFVPDAKILLFGETYTLKYIQGRGHPTRCAQSRRLIIPCPDASAFKGRVKRFLIRLARQELETATHVYAKTLGKSVEKISVRDTSSRWGSCITRAGRGHISYSWRLVCAPDYVLNYVCAHECAHMIEPNHSAAYWKVVASLYPDYKRASKWLKINGAKLHAVGSDT